MLTMGTFCSGIGAPEVAAEGLFDPLWFSEIEPFPKAVLAARWPNVPDLGDMTAPDIVDRIAAIGLPDVVVAGLPCQPFSVAGLRKGEADPRNLTARFVEIADAIDDLRRDAGQPPVWWLVENVPGLMSDRGNAFGSLLGGMVGSDAAIVPNGRWENAGVADGPRRCAAWRILDAQFFGLAQRRRRVFALFVGGADKWACADALLPVIESMLWHSPPVREPGQVAPTIPARSLGGGGLGTDFDCDGGLVTSTGDVAHCLNAGGMGRQDYETETMVAHSLRGEGFDASEDGTGRGTPLVPVVFGMTTEQTPKFNPDCALTLTKQSPTGGGQPQAVAYAIQERAVSDQTSQVIAFGSKDHGADAAHDVCPTLRAGGHAGSHANAGVPPAVAFDLNQITSKTNRSNPDPAVHHTLPASVCPPHLETPWAVRRLTPTECHRLQGFSDDHCAITVRGKPAADGPQYKALGNSMAVPVVGYILSRMKNSMAERTA